MTCSCGHAAESHDGYGCCRWVPAGAGAGLCGCAVPKSRVGDEPQKTLPEALDAAQTGEEFGQVLQGLFGFLERAKDEERDA